MNILKTLVIAGAFMILAGLGALITNAVLPSGDTPPPIATTLDLVVSGRISTIIPIDNGGVVALVESMDDNGPQELLFFHRRGTLQRQVRLIQQEVPNRQVALVPTPR
ncbi:MAG: hypothetical protein HQL58_02425 [Magnetococcales bacterium]|nr:hypothetical protein [Magnetococcales bacterium]